jgi:hypothetical protein
MQLMINLLQRINLALETISKDIQLRLVTINDEMERWTLLVCTLRL